MAVVATVDAAVLHETTNGSGCADVSDIAVVIPKQGARFTRRPPHHEWPVSTEFAFKKCQGWGKLWPLHSLSETQLSLTVFWALWRQESVFCHLEAHRRLQVPLLRL